MMFLLTALTGIGAAADWAFSPSISVSETYDSNINFRYHNLESDFITSIKPKFLLTGRTEQDQLNLDSTLNGMIYVKNNQLDRVETFNNVSWIRQWSSRFASDLGASFIKTTSLESQLEEAGIRTTLADQYSYGFRAKGSYALTEALSLALGGTVGQTWYPDKEFSDSDTATGNLSLAWKYSDFDTFGMDNLYSYKHYLDATTDNVQYFRPGLFWEHTFSETASLLLGAGYRRSEIEYLVSTLEYIPPRQLAVVKKHYTTRNNSYDFWATLRKRWSERLSSSLSAGRDQYSDSNGVTYNHMFVSTGFDYALTELTKVGLNLRYDNNSGIEGGIKETNYFRVIPTLDRKLTKDLTLRLAGSYEYQTQKYATATYSEDTDRYRAWVELVWQLPRLMAAK